jgi:hypothetical protein
MFGEGLAWRGHGRRSKSLLLVRTDFVLLHSLFFGANTLNHVHTLVNLHKSGPAPYHFIHSLNPSPRETELTSYFFLFLFNSIQFSLLYCVATVGRGWNAAAIPTYQNPPTCNFILRPPAGYRCRVHRGGCLMPERQVRFSRSDPIVPLPILDPKNPPLALPYPTFSGRTKNIHKN